MGWISEATDEAKKALGVRKYTLISFGMGALSVGGAVLGGQMSLLLGTLIVALALLLLLAGCLLDQAVKYRRRLTPRIKIDALKIFPDATVHYNRPEAEEGTLATLWVKCLNGQVNDCFPELLAIWKQDNDSGWTRTDFPPSHLVWTARGHGGLSLREGSPQPFDVIFTNKAGQTEPRVYSSSRIERSILSTPGNYRIDVGVTGEDVLLDVRSLGVEVIGGSITPRIELIPEPELSPYPTMRDRLRALAQRWKYIRPNSSAPTPPTL